MPSFPTTKPQGNETPSAVGQLTTAPQDVGRLLGNTPTGEQGTPRAYHLPLPASSRPCPVGGQGQERQSDDLRRSSGHPRLLRGKNQQTNRMPSVQPTRRYPFDRDYSCRPTTTSSTGTTSLRSSRPTSLGLRADLQASSCQQLTDWTTAAAPISTTL